MLSFPGAALLSAAIGAAVGLLAAWVPARRRPTVTASIAIGVAGAVLAGFVLPQFGTPVSKSLSMGIVTATIGAALPVAGWLVLRSTHLKGDVRPAVFAFVWRADGVLCFLNAGLVLASVPLAGHTRISQQSVAVSAVVALVLVAAGFLFLRIAGQMLAICHLLSPGTLPLATADLLRGLLTSLILAGLACAMVLALVVVAFVDRIGAGFAIFG